MNQLEEKYSAEIKNVLTNLPYKKDLDFLKPYLPEIPIGNLYITPETAKKLFDGKASYFVAGNLFNALINTKPKHLHSNYLMAMDLLQIVMDLSKEWEKDVSPLRDKAMQKVMNENALEQKKSIQLHKQPIILPGR